jgi:hypothetical protein
MYYLHPYKALTSDVVCIRYIKRLLSRHLGGGPLVFGAGDEKILALSGFYPEDKYAVNFLALLLYMWKKASWSYRLWPRRLW